MASKGKKNSRRPAPVLLVLVALALCLILTTCAGKDYGPPNVIFITMDSLRHDRLGCLGHQNAHTPNIDALAADGVVFPEALAQGTYTRISLPSIVTGKIPRHTGIRSFAHGSLDSSQVTLAEVLSAGEYATMATNRMWSSSFYQGFKESHGATDPTYKRTERAIQSVEKHQEGKFFIWLYYWNPHAPYEPPEEYMQLFEPDYRKLKGFDPDDPRDASGHFNGSILTMMMLNQKKILATAPDIQHLFNLYDAEIAFVDSEIGKLTAWLKDHGQYDNTLIVLNADHGEAFGEHGKFYHGLSVFDEEARVPLVIKPPGSKSLNKVIRGQVRNIDIMPTILDYCGLEVPSDCDGRSLRPYIEGREPPSLPTTIETGGGERNQMMAYRHENYKVTYDLSDGLVWLYDLQADPGEKMSLLPNSATIVPAPDEEVTPARQKEQQMREEMLDFVGLEKISDLVVTGKDLKEIDSETLEQLKALGYVY